MIYETLKKFFPWKKNGHHYLGIPPTALLTYNGPHTVELSPDVYLYNLPISQLQESADIKISILVPSRSRPKLLERSLGTLMDTATDPQRLQIIIRTDLCDKYMVGFKFPKCNNVKLLRGPRMKGYGSLHFFYTECAMHASGALLVLWNDDARMLTQGWDEKLWNETADQRKNGRPGFWSLSNNHWPFAFPVVTRSVIERLGAFSRFSYNDAYIHELARACKIAQPVLENIKIQHDMLPTAGWDGKSYDLYKTGFFKDIIEADAKLIMR